MHDVRLMHDLRNHNGVLRRMADDWMCLRKLSEMQVRNSVFVMTEKLLITL